MKTITLLTLAMFVVGAIAAPAMADPDHADSDERKDAAQERSDKRADKASDRPDKASDKRDDKHHDLAAKKDERRNATIAKAQERCDAYENRTGRDVPACDRLDDVYEHGKQARRVAHALMKAIDALEHRVVKLEKLEVRVMGAMEDGNLTDNQTAKFEAKLVRIQAAQNKTLEKLEKMEDRLEKLKAKWDGVRDHVKDHAKVIVCHEGDEGNHTIRISRHAWPAHERHGDSLGACADDGIESDLAAEESDAAPESDEAGDDAGDESDEADADEADADDSDAPDAGSEGNATADPEP